MHSRTVTAPVILTVLFFTGCAEPITEWTVPERQASVSLSAALLSNQSPRVAVLHEPRSLTEQNAVRLDLQHAQTKHGHGTGTEFVVHEPRGDVAFDRDLRMQKDEPRPVTAALKEFLAERGCTLAEPEFLERTTRDLQITTDVRPELVADFGRKLGADVLLVYATLGANHAYYASKDRAWTYHLDPEMQIEGRFIAVPDGRTLGTFQLRTNLAAEQGVKRLALYAAGDKDLQIRAEGKRGNGLDPWQAAADALRAELAKQWPK
jgi:hypothetical protein